MGQPLFGLAYFSQLSQFFHSHEFITACFIRGNELWSPETLTVANLGRKKAIEAIEWLEKAKRVAKYFKINPPFPKADKINADETESKDAQLMFKLIESGAHEQTNVEQTVGISAEDPYTGPEIGKKELTANWTEPFREINFLGVKIPFGPLSHTWTDLELIETRPIENNHTEMLFKGGKNSSWRIEYTKNQPGT